jgi:hypothetical protein
MEPQKSPEAQAKRKLLHDILGEFKTRMNKAGFIGLMVLADALEVAQDDAGTMKGVLQIVTAKTLVADYTIFNNDVPGKSMVEKENYTEYQLATTIKLLETFIELLQHEIAAHKNLLSGVQLLDMIDNPNGIIYELMNRDKGFKN